MASIFEFYHFMIMIWIVFGLVWLSGVVSIGVEMLDKSNISADQGSQSSRILLPLYFFFVNSTFLLRFGNPGAEHLSYEMSEQRPSGASSQVRRLS